MDEKKFRELVLYIAKKSESDRHFGYVKLNKILFYSDFLAFAMTGEPITGDVYQALERGPAPKNMVEMRQRMVDEGDCAIQSVDRLGVTQQRVIALRDPDLSGFTGREIAIVNEIIEALRNKSAGAASALSHQFAGWKAAGFKEEIPYGTVFISGRDLTPGEKQYAKNLEPTCVG